MPAILEYIPYRKRDGTARRDDADPSLFRRPRLCLPCASTCAAAAIPTALFDDEYLQQEQDDALEVIAWLAAQPWCTGTVGMMGISWGGFNGLQVAALPPAGAEGHHHALLHRRPLRRRHPLHGRLPAERQHRLGVDDVLATTRGRPTPRSSASAGATMWLERLENAAAPGRRLAAPPAPRRLLEARLGLRGLRARSQCPV